MDMISLDIRTQASNPDASQKSKRKKSISGILKKKTKVTRTADFGMVNKLKCKTLKTDNSFGIPDSATQDLEEKLASAMDKSSKNGTERQIDEKIIPRHLNFCVKDHADRLPKKYETGSRSSFRKNSLINSLGGIDLASVKERLKQLKKGSMCLPGSSSIRSGGSMKNPVNKDMKRSSEAFCPNSTSRLLKGNRAYKQKKKPRGTFSHMIKGSYSNNKKGRESTDISQNRYQHMESTLDKKQKNLTNL